MTCCELQNLTTHHFMSVSDITKRITNSPATKLGLTACLSVSLVCVFFFLSLVYFISFFFLPFFLSFLSLYPFFLSLVFVLVCFSLSSDSAHPSARLFRFIRLSLCVSLSLSHPLAHFVCSLSAQET